MNDIEELRYLIKAVDRESELNFARRLKTLNITPSQYEILKILSFRNGLSISEIGKLLICGSESPSRLIDRLFTKRLVEKNNSELDSRIVNISITPQGMKVLKKAKAVEDKFNADILSALDKEITVQQLIEVLRKQVASTKTFSKIEKRKKIQQ